MHLLPITLLAAAGFLSMAGARVVDPLLHVIASDFATTVPVASVVIAAFTLPYGLCQILLGPLGDRLGKLRVLLGGLSAFAVCTGACALAGSLPVLTVLRVFAGAASAAIIPVGMAYIADAVPYAARQVTLSRFLNGVVLAQLLAGPVGGVFGEYLGWRGVFVLLAAIAAGVAGVLALRLRSLPDARAPDGHLSPRAYRALLASAIGRLVLAAAFIDGALMGGCFPFLAPYMHEGFGLSYAAVGLILSSFGFGALGYTRSAQRLVPLLGEPGMVLCGAMVMAAGLAIAMLTPAWPALIATQAAIGFGFYLLHAVLQARASELLPSARATAVAGFAFALFAGQSVGAVAMGAAIAGLDYRRAFAADAALLLGFGLWLSLSLRQHAPGAAAAVAKR